MSVLEDIGSVAETPSPSASVQPRSRLRASRRISERFHDRMREAEDEKHADTDESSPQVSRRRSQRARSSRLTTRGSSEEEDGDEQEEEEIDDDDDDNDTVDQERETQEHDEDDDEQDEEEEEEEEEDGGRQSRYSFRERRSVKKPMRFDQNIYDEVFQQRTFADEQPPRESRRRDRRRDRDNKPSRASSRRSSRAQSKRRRLDDDDDDDVGDEVDELDYATDESDIELIQRRIEEQELVEAAEAAAAVAAVEALESAPRHTRSTRYALRHRDAKDSLSPVRSRASDRSGSKSVNRRRSHSGDAARRVKYETRHQEEDGDDDDEQQEESPGKAGRRYYLRQRSQSDPHDQEDEQMSAQSSRSSRRIMTRNDRRGRDHERDRRRRAREELQRDQAIAAAFAADDSGPRYSLRDRSKVQRSEGVLAKDPSLAAYADFAKRQTHRAAQRGTGHSSFPSSATERRSVKRNRKRRSDRRRRLSSSSSSSSSDDMFKYYDSDQGGMRTGGSRRKSHGENKHRADISPVEVDRSITWDSVGGLEKHIEALKEMVMLPLLYPEFYEKYNVTPPSGVLFYGPPGTGKTLLARALANSCSIEDDSPATKISIDASEVLDKKPRHVTFYMRKGADCLSKWVGEAERQLRLLFEEAKRNQPSIIFFDEIDGLAPVRSAKQDQIHASIVSTLLALMDGMDSRGRVVVIGATNRLDAIDPALRRPGRFDRELGFKLPNVAERKKMVEIHTKKWNPPLSEAFVQEIAQKTVGYCGADVKALCAEAALCSLRRVYPQVYGSQDKLLIQLDKIVVSRGDFTKAMKKITPASHRTVSSFAAPLPKGVKALLDAPLSAILREIADRFPLFPLDHQAIDALYKTDGATRAAVPSSLAGDDDDDENEDEDIYAVMNRDDCDVCHGDEGELICCDACPGAFHASCLPSDHNRPSAQSTDWFCPECEDSEKMEALLEAKQKKAQQRKARQMYSLPQLVGFPRVLITGGSGMGQEYIAAALLHAMEGLTHFALDYPSLVADVNTHSAEEALIHRLHEAQKCLPCVIFLPQIDLWWENTPESMHTALKMMLMNMQIKANLPVLFLATTSSTDLNGLPKSLLDLYNHDRTIERSSITWQLSGVAEDSRKIHFGQAFAAIGANPLPRKKRRRGDEKLEVLPLAPVVKKSKREPTLAELERIREHDLHCLRELRIFLGQVLDYCAGQRTYSPFHHPVDPEAVPDYYLIIKSPMDLSTMRERLNDGDYTCFEQFLDDIQLIVRNANMFNPKRSATRHIAQAAGTMKDNILSFAHRFRKHQGYDLFAKCREITKRLHTNPALYSEVPDTTNHRHKQGTQTPPKAPSRVSDRLRGIHAPEITTGDVTLLKTRNEVKPKSIDSNSNVASRSGDDSVVPQWFHSSAPSSPSDPEPAIAQDDSAVATDSADSVDASETNAPDEFQVFEEGDNVFVLPRTFPGMNKLGGVGKVIRRNEDGTYYVKYSILGGSEKNVEPMFVRMLTDEAVKESVKNQRNNAHSSSPGKALSTAEREPVKTKTEIQAEFFDNLVWPILIDEGWKREEIMDVTEDGSTSVSMRFSLRPTSEDSTEIALEGIDQVLDYINKDRGLAVKCFGKRFAEELPTEAVFGENGSEGIASLDDKDATTEAPVTAADSDGTREADAALMLAPVTESETTAEVTVEEENEEAQEFIYDEGRMSTALDDLVKRTAGWTVGELRDELLLLNKLAYPFRYEFDRSKLMQEVEDHIANLSR